MNAIEPAQHFLSNSGTSNLKTLLNQVKYIGNLQQALLPLLSKELQPYVQVANTESDTLILQADNACWGTLLRYEIPLLLEKCKDNALLKAIKNIRFFIKPTREESTLIFKHDPKPISQQNTLNLQVTAQQVSNPLLKKSLEALSKRYIQN